MDPLKDLRIFNFFEYFGKVTYFEEGEQQCPGHDNVSGSIVFPFVNVKSGCSCTFQII